MWARLHLDISWSDLLFGPARAWLGEDRDVLTCEVESLFGAGRALAALSVRSAFDLLLQEMALPRGSEILFSAITIPHMPKIAEAHGLVPVPVDLDPGTLSVDADALRAAMTSRTRAIVVAHLCGATRALDDVFAVAREQGLAVIEDCAQCYAGPGNRGNPGVLASLYSFGTIKTATALGGAMAVIRDDRLREAMRASHCTWPVATNREYLTRLPKFALVKGLSTRPLAAMVHRVASCLGSDHDRWLTRVIRGFPGADFLRRIRRQPSQALLTMLRSRLARFDERSLQHRVAAGERLWQALDDAGSGIEIPGRAAIQQSHWLHPVLVDDPVELVRRLAAAGFDATHSSNLCVVEGPEFRSPPVASEILRRIVFLPSPLGMSRTVLQRMASIVASAGTLRGYPEGHLSTTSLRPVHGEVGRRGRSR